MSTQVTEEHQRSLIAERAFFERDRRQEVREEAVRWFEDRRRKLDEKKDAYSLRRHDALGVQAERLAQSKGTSLEEEIERITRPAREKEAEPRLREEAAKHAAERGTTVEYELQVVRAEFRGDEAELNRLHEVLANAEQRARSEGKTVGYELRRQELNENLERAIESSPLRRSGPVSSIQFRDSRAFEAFLHLEAHVSANPLDRDRLQLATVIAASREQSVAAAAKDVDHRFPPEVVQRAAEIARQEGRVVRQGQEAVPPQERVVAPLVVPGAERGVQGHAQAPQPEQHVQGQGHDVAQEQARAVTAAQEQAQARSLAQAQAFADEQRRNRELADTRERIIADARNAEARARDFLRLHDETHQQYAKQREEREWEHALAPGVGHAGPGAALRVAARNDLADILEKSSREKVREDEHQHSSPSGLAAEGIMQDRRTSAHAADIGVVPEAKAEQSREEEFHLAQEMHRQHEDHGHRR